MVSSFRKRLDNLDHVTLFLIIAVLIGGYIRLSPVLSAEMPINDGGMFYVMTQELIDNEFAIPVTTGYNGLDIPYAYPPLSFYITGVLHQLMGWQIIDIIRILPAVFSVLSIVAFYFLAKEMIEDQAQKIIAILMFTFIPTTFDWLIMGGGLTRSVAFFFSLLATRSIYRLYTQNNKSDVIWAGLFSSLTVLSHPEAALHTAVTALIFFLFLGRHKRGVIRSFIVAVMVLSLTAFWWGTVIVRRGISTFFTAGSTGFFGLAQIFNFFNFTITHEPGLQVLGVLGVIGVFWCIAKKQYLLPIWLVVNFLAEPRSAPLYLSANMVMLSSFSLVQILALFNAKKEDTKNEKAAVDFLDSGASKGLFLLFFGTWIYSAWATILTLTSGLLLSSSDLNAFNWIKENTAPESQVLVLTLNEPFSDPVTEWFPALTDRVSITTVQGREWSDTVPFEDFFAASVQVQKCLSQEYDCIQQWAVENDMSYDYIYIHNPLQLFEGTFHETALGVSSEQIGVTELVYQVDEVSIYRVQESQ